MDGDKPVCFWKDSILDFLDPSMPMRWFEFEPDRGVGKVKQSHKAGFFSIRLFINDVTLNGEHDPSTIPAWNLKLSKRLKVWKLRVNIYQCESLPPADENGTSDPYIEVWTPDEKQVKTSTCEDTNNPIFYETLEIPIEFNHLERAPPIILSVWDTDLDLLDSSDDFIGRAVILLS
mmetsp:Transcript_20973/g.32507  ORF Transcript_20973/g.32507 Transcript_20973/m.32507 type:complete len:176 (+) Transcript_20973:1400-1927(+)